MEIDITTSTYPSSHTENMFPQYLDPSNHTNTVLSFDSSIYHIPPTINKKTMTTYNQHQVSEIKYSYILSIHSQPTTPTASINTNYRKEKASFLSLEKNLTKLRHQFPPVLTSNNMWDNNNEKKNVCTNLLQIIEITEQTTITD